MNKFRKKREFSQSKVIGDTPMERVCAAEIRELMHGLPQSGAERDRVYRERKKLQKNSEKPLPKSPAERMRALRKRKRQLKPVKQAPKSDAERKRASRKRKKTETPSKQLSKPMSGAERVHKFRQKGKNEKKPQPQSGLQRKRTFRQRKQASFISLQKNAFAWNADISTLTKYRNEKALRFASSHPKPSGRDGQQQSAVTKRKNRDNALKSNAKRKKNTLLRLENQENMLRHQQEQERRKRWTSAITKQDIDVLSNMLGVPTLTVNDSMYHTYITKSPSPLTLHMCINWSNSYTLLQFAAKAGCVESVKLLLSKSADIEKVSSRLNSDSPVFLAAGASHLAVLRVLIQQKASLQKKGHISRLLADGLNVRNVHAMATDDDIAVFNCLREAGFRFNFDALWDHADRGDIKTVKFLSKDHRCINSIRDKWHCALNGPFWGHFTPLMQAIWKKHVGVVQYLITAKAIATFENDRGISALSLLNYQAKNDPSWDIIKLRLAHLMKKEKTRQISIVKDVGLRLRRVRKTKYT